MTHWDSLGQVSCTKFLGTFYSKGSGPPLGQLVFLMLLGCFSICIERWNNWDEKTSENHPLYSYFLLSIGRPVWCTRDIHLLHKRENLHHIVHESERYPLITKCPPNFERNTDRILWPTITSIDLFPEFACHIFKLWEITSQEWHR